MGCIIFFIIGGCLLALLSLNLRIRAAMTCIQVFEHELTHALICLLQGGRLLNMNISQSAGSVTTTKSNMLVRLSPYIVPLFTICTICLGMIVMPKWRIWTSLVAGVFYANYMLNSFDNLSMQTDILRSGGRLVSYPIICTGNIITSIVVLRLMKM